MEEQHINVTMSLENGELSLGIDADINGPVDATIMAAIIVKKLSDDFSLPNALICKMIEAAAGVLGTADHQTIDMSNLVKNIGGNNNG